MKIEKPNWSSMLWAINSSGEGFSMAQNQRLDEWFQEQVTPFNKLLAEGVEVQRSNQGGWYLHATDVTDTALLINIQPIKVETASDVLRAFVDSVDYAKASETDAELLDVFYKKSQAVLKGKT